MNTATPGRSPRAQVFVVVAWILISAVLQAPNALAQEVELCPLSPQTWETSLVSLATPTTSGWVGGDGFFSAKLNDSQTIFLNGDTFFGTREGESFTSGAMHRNSVLVHDTLRSDCWLTIPADTNAGVFPTGGNPAEDWYWPAEPLVRGSEVMVPLSRWSTIPGWSEEDSQWNFQWVDDELRKYTWNGSELALVSTRQLDFDPVRAPDGVSGPMYWFGALEDGPWVYMFGTSVRTGNFAHDAYLARVPAEEYFATTSAPLFPAAEFLTVTGWRTGTTFAELQRIITAESDSTVSAVKVNGRYHLITKEMSIFGDEVLDFHAPAIEGPYERYVLADIPPCPHAMTYGASVHEVIDTAGSGRVSLSINQGWSGAGSECYSHMEHSRPILFEARLPELDAVPAVGSQFQPIPPVRVYDSRQDRFGSQPIATSSPVAIDVTDSGRVPVPPGATAVAYNLTATGQTSSGYATVTTDVATAGSTSVLNWSRAQETVGNGHVGNIDANLTLAVHVGGRGSAHIVLDVLGFYQPPEPTTSVFVPLVPTRVYDSRLTGPPVAAGNRLAIDFRSPAPEIPASATAVAFNVTATGTGSSGYFAMTPGDTTTPPPVSTLNWASSQTTVANASKLALDGGRATLFVTGSEAHAIVDVFGYFVPASQLPVSAQGYEFYPIAAERAYDSRHALNPLAPTPDGGAGVPRPIWAGLFGRVPNGSFAVEANITVTGTGGSGYIRVDPAGSATATSVQNWTRPLTTRANATTVPVSQTRVVEASVAGSGAHAVIDVSGYYR